MDSSRNPPPTPPGPAGVPATGSRVPPNGSRVAVTGSRVAVHGLEFDDGLAAAQLGRGEADPAELLVRMIAVGARGLASMGLGLELGDVDRRVRATVAEALEQGRRQVGDTLSELQRVVTGSLDPDQRASVVSRCLVELEGFRLALADSVDPTRHGSHASALLAEMNAMLGPGGVLEQRLQSALDPETDGSSFAAALRRLESRLDQLHQSFAETRGRVTEAERGAAKGVVYEDELEERLRRWARGRGATVERTSVAAGERGQDLVGDFVVHLAEGRRVVVEAKSAGSLSLHGRGGILAELRRALDNRSAQAALCLSREAAFPAEVGSLGIYGDVVLAVDGDDDTILTAALAIAAHRAGQAATPATVVDTVAAAEKVERVRNLALQLSSSRRALTDIVGAVEKVRCGLEAVRGDLMEAAADIELALDSGEPPAPTAPVIPLGEGTSRSRLARAEA